MSGKTPINRLEGWRLALHLRKEEDEAGGQRAEQRQVGVSASSFVVEQRPSFMQWNQPRARKVAAPANRRRGEQSQAACDMIVFIEGTCQ